MESEGLLPSSPEPATGHYLEPVQSNPHHVQPWISQIVSSFQVLGKFLKSDISREYFGTSEVYEM
jgi:hypothetical protein